MHAIEEGPSERQYRPNLRFPPDQHSMFVIGLNILEHDLQTIENFSKDFHWRSTFVIEEIIDPNGRSMSIRSIDYWRCTDDEDDHEQNRNPMRSFDNYSNRFEVLANWKRKIRSVDRNRNIRTNFGVFFRTSTIISMVIKLPFRHNVFRFGHRRSSERIWWPEGNGLKLRLIVFTWGNEERSREI